MDKTTFNALIKEIKITYPWIVLHDWDNYDSWTTNIIRTGGIDIYPKGNNKSEIINNTLYNIKHKFNAESFFDIVWFRYVNNEHMAFHLFRRNYDGLVIYE